MFFDLQMGIKKWIDRWLMINCFCYNSKKDILLCGFLFVWRGRRSKEGVGRAMQNLFHIFNMGSTFSENMKTAATQTHTRRKRTKNFAFFLLAQKLREIWALKDLPSSSYIFCTFSPFSRLHCFLTPIKINLYCEIASPFKSNIKVGFPQILEFRIVYGTSLLTSVMFWSDAKNLREIGIFCK